MPGKDYVKRPLSTGLPSPVNEFLIVKDGKVVPTGEAGEIWMYVPAIRLFLLLLMLYVVAERIS